MTRRVVITGMGLISPLGNSPDALWAGLSSGTSGVRPLSCIPAEGLPISCAGEAAEFTGDVANFGPLEKDQKRAIKRGSRLMCREIQMGVAAAQLGLQNAGLAAGSYNPERTGVIFGSDYIMTMPDEYVDGVKKCFDDQSRFQMERWGDEGLGKVPPLWLLKYLPNMPASHIAIYNDLRGPSNSITQREASGNLALAEAFCTVRGGRADSIIAGATGTRLHPLRSVHVILQDQICFSDRPPEEQSRPYDQDRAGIVLAEGAGAVLVEDLEHANARNAKIWGEIIGYGASTVQAPDGSSDIATAVYNALKMAANQADLGQGAIGHIQGHGISATHSDAQEAAGIARFCKEIQDDLTVTTTRGHLGHVGAGGGVIGVIAGLQSMAHQQLFPVLNCEKVDSEFSLRVCQASQEAGEVFLNLSFTPQGQASCLAVRAA